MGIYLYTSGRVVLTLEMQKKYWKWYRIAYLFFGGITALFFGTRVVETLHYWDQLFEWQINPGRWYMMFSGILLCLISTTGSLLYLFFHKRRAKWICILNTIIVVWVWVEQLILSQIPDRFGKIPFLLAGTLILTGWTYLVFRQEFVHE